MEKGFIFKGEIFKRGIRHKPSGVVVEEGLEYSIIYIDPWGYIQEKKVKKEEIEIYEISDVQKAFFMAAVANVRFRTRWTL